VLATTKGDLPEFERQVQNREGPAKGLYNPYLLALELARDLKIEGTVLAVSGACATGLLAMIHAVRLVQRGGTEAVVAVGVDVLSDFVLSGFSSVGALAPEPCRPYDEKRNGLSLGEGAGAVVLVPRGTYPQKELALISGWGVANDARHITAPSPTANGLIQALRQTMAMACLEVDEVHYLNAHGTGTIYNDAMEAKAIHQVFGESPPPVSSMKGYFGHTLGAAGIIEAALTVVALRCKTVPASLGLEHPGADILIQPVATHLHRTPLTHALTIKSGFGGINVALSLSALPSL
jgi:3-oxoacyl-(acyl-carrier-protein) synthase